MHLNLSLRSLLPTFVPAKFKDVGHSVVRDASTGKNLVIVDSVQSIANHLESTLIDQPGHVIAGLEGLPYVRLTITDPNGRCRTTSSLELPHRLASGWFCRPTERELRSFQEALSQRILDEGIAAATFRYCPNSLLHGVFYSQLVGLNPNIAKSARLLTAEVVAFGAQSVADGGVAKDPLFISGDDFDVTALVGNNATAAQVGAGNIIFRHQAFIAERIELAVYLAEGRISRLQVPDPAKEVLRLLAMFKLAKMLAEPIDLRAHCIFKAETIPEELGDLDGLLGQLAKALEQCHTQNLFADPLVTEITLILEAPNVRGGRATVAAAAGVEAGE